GRRAGGARVHTSRGSLPSVGATGEITSPIQGTVLTVAVEPGQQVSAGSLVCVIEAMKMENEILAPTDGVVASVEVAPGQAVQIGARLAVIEPAAG
ncbi:MAG: carbamoyl phosphate synthase, partial [Thermomicrobiaceae bacterium]|nr:carbamoyl phosphate synthase [Thermomicrobiaceae bacterium]